MIARIFTTLVLFLMMIIAFAALRKIMLQGTDLDGVHLYSDADRLAGLHCLDPDSLAHPGVVAELEGRIGKPITYNEDSTSFGPLQPDGTRQITMVYQIITIGQRPRPAKAIGTMRNDDCSATISVLVR